VWNDLKFLKINGVRTAAFCEQHNLKKGVPVWEVQVVVRPHEIADPGDQKFGETLVGA